MVRFLSGVTEVTTQNFSKQHLQLMIYIGYCLKGIPAGSLAQIGEDAFQAMSLPATGQTRAGFTTSSTARPGPSRPSWPTPR